jgi:hypothetical protein
MKLKDENFTNTVTTFLRCTNTHINYCKLQEVVMIHRCAWLYSN